MISLLALLAGFLLDLLIGDPHFLYHPVRLVGALISFLEKVIRKIFPKTEKGELAGGSPCYGRDDGGAGAASLFCRPLVRPGEICGGNDPLLLASCHQVSEG